jgi:hypothetical protein
LTNLALLRQARGDLEGAVLLQGRALGIIRRHVELTSTVQSERQQLLMAGRFREELESYPALTSLAKAPVAQSYEQALSWKGAVFLRQRRSRFGQRRPDAASVFTEFQHTTSRLAALALARPGAKTRDAHGQQVATLARRREDLETKLTRLGGNFGEDTQLSHLSPALLQKLFPEDAALVDFFHTRKPEPIDGPARESASTQLMAFVVRSNQPPARVELGDAREIETLIDQWRGRIQGNDDGTPGAKDRTAGRVLRRRLLEPMIQELKGVRTLLISPEGALARLPFAALPGKRPDSFLIEDVAVALVPFPQALPLLLQKGKGKSEVKPSLLLVGAVDYDASTEIAPELVASTTPPSGGPPRLMWLGLRWSAWRATTYHPVSGAYRLRASRLLRRVASGLRVPARNNF